jgi:hypothetical protein
MWIVLARTAEKWDGWGWLGWETVLVRGRGSPCRPTTYVPSINLMEVPRYIEAHTPCLHPSTLIAGVSRRPMEGDHCVPCASY